jgi:hypothetical protein
MFESNNAGAIVRQFKLSQDNIELQFATNHLGILLISFFDVLKLQQSLAWGAVLTVIRDILVTEVPFLFIARVNQKYIDLNQK